jgi:uroporphyrinogen III methyltransferase / synthase
VRSELGTVVLVGAGPGDPGLITVKGLKCLRRAEVVVYDFLANPLFLEEAPPEAEKIFVGKTRGCHTTPQEEINAMLARKAREGKRVVRLKGGDPFVFGRGGEEAQYLAQRGIPFEVVPGVTAAFAAGAYAGIPVTHRDYTTSIGLVTGHLDPNKKMASLDWEKLAKAVGTLAFYMGMGNLPLITRELIAHGRSPQTPVAVISWATTPRQRTLVSTLGRVVEEVEKNGMRPPAVILVGDVVNLRKELRWFEDRPLAGKRILVTRSSRQAGELVSLLEEQGAEAHTCPVFDILPPENETDIETAVADLPDFDYLVLTSVNAVEAVWRKMRAAGFDARRLQGVTLVAVGPKTAESLQKYGLFADLCAREYRAEGVVELLESRDLAGKRILYPCSDKARDLIQRELSAAGAEVIAPVAYRTVRAEKSREKIADILNNGKLDAVTFTSSSSVEFFLDLGGKELLDRLEGVALVSMGPLTTAEVRRAGLEVAFEAPVSTIEGLVEALKNYFANDNG